MSRRAFLAAAVGAAGGIAAFPWIDSVWPDHHAYYGPETRGGWHKYPGNPVLGGGLGTCFDVSLLYEAGTFRMWFSWRPRGGIGLVESRDGVHWSPPILSLAPQELGWEAIVNRPTVLRRASGYDMWYTGQSTSASMIGRATSPDGRQWRSGSLPVLEPVNSWEKSAVMCPDVMWNAGTHEYTMWYSGGDQFEPDAIGYATSPDGKHWTRLGPQPIFTPNPNQVWERQKVTACQVVRDADWYLMFYVGFADPFTACIGLARSRDGIHDWQRHPRNPIIEASSRDGAWDYDGVYKPFAIRMADHWLLWYNGRNKTMEQIGLAVHPGTNLGFDERML